MSIVDRGLLVLGESTPLIRSEPAVLTLALAAPVIDGHGSNPKLCIRGLCSLLNEILEQGYAASEVQEETFIGADAGLHGIQRGAPDPSKQETNLGFWINTH